MTNSYVVQFESETDEQYWLECMADMTQPHPDENGPDCRVTWTKLRNLNDD